MERLATLALALVVGLPALAEPPAKPGGAASEPRAETGLPAETATPLPAPVAAAAPEPAVAAAPEPEEGPSEIETLVLEGHFRTALAVAQASRESLAAEADAPGVAARLARLEVAVATAEIALGRDNAARTSLGRALAAHPELSLDESNTSPKVLRALAEARARSGGA